MRGRAQWQDELHRIEAAVEHQHDKAPASSAMMLSERRRKRILAMTIATSIARQISLSATHAYTAGGIPLCESLAIASRPRQVSGRESMNGTSVKAAKSSQTTRASASQRTCAAPYGVPRRRERSARLTASASGDALMRVASSHDDDSKSV